jgi:adenylate cyclase
MLGLRVADPAPLEILRLKTFDFYQLILKPKPSPEQVVIIDIDEKSLNKLGQWPWPRTILARLVDFAANAGAAAIGFDVQFPENDRTSPANVADVVESYDAATAGKLRAMKSNDEVFGEAMAKARVVLGQSGSHREIKQWHASKIETSAIATLGPDPARFIDTYPGLVRNVPELEASAKGRGMVSINPEKDGIVRKLPFIMKAQDLLLPAFGLELIRVATGQATILIKSENSGVASLNLAGVQMPADRNAKAWVHFRPHNQNIFFSASDVLENKVPPQVFKGRIVLVGTSAAGLFDIKATPVDPAMPGVEIHAQLINAILTQSLLKRPAWASGMEVILTVLIGLLLIALLPRLGAFFTIAAGAIIAVSVTAGCWWAFANYKLIFDYAFPLLTSLAVTGLMVSLGYLQEEIDRRRIRTAFGQYLSQDMVNRLADNPDQLTLGGETKSMTILFSDVRGFTTISETYKSNPQGLTMLINSLLTPLSEAVVAHRGTIDKYMGDNIMAFWNAPLPDDNHAMNACLAALDMSRRLDLLNEERRANGEVPLEIGVGINSGDCVVGNMGSDLRFDYTVLGDAVNLASRLEGQTKSYGVLIIIGEGTAVQVQEKIAVLHVDRIRVKGKTEPEEIYAVIGNEEAAASGHFRQLADAHEQLLKAYFGQDWKTVRKLSANCKTLAQEYNVAALYDVYDTRAANFIKQPPPKDWDGVNDRLEK